jgi:AcrR family transcriptional regulator
MGSTRKVPPSPRQRRPVVPAAQAQELLLESAIRLLRTNPFDEATARRIAAEAGLDTSAIARNFGSMHGLFVAVCKRLTAQTLERSHSRRVAASAEIGLQLMTDPDLALRNRLVAWMIVEGMDPGVEKGSYRATLATMAAEFQSRVSVTDRTAMLWMQVTALIAEALAVFEEVHFLEPADRLDAMQLMLKLRDRLPEVEQEITWVGVTDGPDR